MFMSYNVILVVANDWSPEAPQIPSEEDDEGDDTPCPYCGEGCPGLLPLLGSLPRGRLC
ncbi:unnamed protein product [Arabidopsis thaliana]|uniref:(thale cress) hypothetical protein n=1 Tax=Arabidopsis thaliana TaxID=3702 RepID=A0A7G2EVD4_ARATH|nr:unnamed protein product [Arabidopsis thaliana]